METVLCVKRADIPIAWVGETSVIKMDEDIFFSAFSTTSSDLKYHWIERAIAEQDSSLKQIIPYIIIQDCNRNRTAIYRRAGGESRLHGLWSIGIGGHINLSDIQPDNHSNKSDIFNNHLFYSKNDFREILYSGMRRELNEELVSLPHISTNRELSYKKELSKDLSVEFLGTINEELTDVGRVHFGVVFRIVADSINSFTPGEELVDFKWVPTSALLDFNMETWSKFAVQLF